VADYRFTEYFETAVLRKRPYLRKEWCIQVVEHPSDQNLRSTIGIASGARSLNSRAVICV
jgi:hypothetical protein